MAGYLSANRPFQPEERLRFRAQLRDTYAAFVRVVAEGRHTTPEAVEPHAQGRVWTGARARAVGLVDHLGGVDLAVERAASLAGLGRVRRVDQHVGPRQGWAQRLFRRFVGAAAVRGAFGGVLPDTVRDRLVEALALDSVTHALVEGAGRPLALSLDAERLSRANG
jgi:ClpP class serine protease